MLHTVARAIISSLLAGCSTAALAQMPVVTAPAEPASTLRAERNWGPLTLKLEPTHIAAAPTLTMDISVRGRHSPGWVRWVGGFVTGSAALVGLMAATWDDPDAIPQPLVYAGYAAGTALGTSLVTAIWERPNFGGWIGAGVGALPIFITMNVKDDGASGNALGIAWLGAPLGAAIGQALGRR